jgi:hypothetical protein
MGCVLKSKTSPLITLMGLIHTDFLGLALNAIGCSHYGAYLEIA